MSITITSNYNYSPAFNRLDKISTHDVDVYLIWISQVFYIT
jgi:hypothetical protein